MHRHSTAEPARPRRGDFIDLDDQTRSIPAQLAGTDGETSVAALDVPCAAFGQRPTPPTLPVECEVEGGVGERVARAAPPRRRVPRRKHATEHGDQGEPMATAVAQRIDIPPGVAVARHGGREIRAGLTHHGGVSILHYSLV